jgi:hypothetical protein
MPAQDLRAFLGAERATIRQLRAHVEHVLDGSLGHQARVRTFGDHDAHPFAHEVEGKLAELRDGRGRGLELRQDGVVERARQARLVEGIERAELEHDGRARARGVVGPLETHHALGERPRLVGAQDIHASEVFDGREVSHQYAVRRHHRRTAREVDAQDGRQELRREAHGQRDGEQQRLQGWALERHVHRKDDDDDDQHHLHEQVAEAA